MEQKQANCDQSFRASAICEQSDHCGPPVRRLEHLMQLVKVAEAPPRLEHHRLRLLRTSHQDTLVSQREQNQ